MNLVPSPYGLVALLVILLFTLGTLTFLAGIAILTLRASSSEIQTLAAQTSKLAQKGLAEDMVGLVANASDLVNSLNQLIRTTRGIGMILIILGLLLMGAASWLAFLIFQMQV